MILKEYGEAVLDVDFGESSFRIPGDHVADVEATPGLGVTAQIVL